MRKLIFDQYEFDNFASEESLEIDIALKLTAKLKQFKDIKEFIAATVGVDASAKLGKPDRYNNHAGYGTIRIYLNRFANIIVPEPCEWLMYKLFEDVLEWHGVFETPDMFIRYRWSSSA